MIFAVILIMEWIISLIGGNFRAFQSIQYNFENIYELTKSSYFNKVCHTHWIAILAVGFTLKVMKTPICTKHSIFQIHTFQYGLKNV